MIDDVSSLLHRWPEPSLRNVASDVGVSIWAVRKWDFRKRVPPEFWADLVASASKRGLADVTAERLLALHARKDAPSEVVEARA